MPDNSNKKIVFYDLDASRGTPVYREPKVSSIENLNKEEGASKYVKIWKGTALLYSKLRSLDPDTIYFVEQEL